MSVVVRLLVATEWPVWRDVTVQSLAESPDAFRPTLAEVVGETDEFWQEMVMPTVEHERFNLWIAFHADAPVGKLFARIDEDFTTIYVGAMWVSPAMRGRGVGRSLIEMAHTWGTDNGVTRSELWATEENEAAVQFYESMGFEPTADTQMLREGSNLVVRRLQMSP